MLNNNIVICSIVILIILISVQNNQNNLTEVDTFTKVLYAVLIGGIIYTLVQNGKLVPNTGTVLTEKFQDEIIDSQDSQNTQNTQNTQIPDESSPSSHEIQSEQPFDSDQPDSEYIQPPSTSKLLADELLPRDQYEGEEGTIVNTDVLDEQYLDATATIGTMSSTLRNANYDLRCAPPIPRVQVGPWQQTTMEPDPFRKPLEGPECGACSQTSNNA